MPPEEAQQTPAEQLEGQIALAFEHQRQQNGPNSTVPPQPGTQQQPAPTATPEEQPGTPAPSIEGGVATPGSQPGTQPGTPPAPPATVEIDGQTYPREDIEALIQFRNWAAANPGMLETFDAIASGRMRAVPLDEQQGSPGAPPPGQQTTGAPAPTGPSEEDLADLPDWVRAQLQSMEEIKFQLGQVQQVVATRQQADASNQVQVGMQQFGQRYDLPSEEVDKLALSLAQTGLMRQFTALAGGDVARATQDALEVMYLRSPANKQRELDRQQRLNAEAEKRQRTASRVSGSSGSASREPEPQAPTQQNLQAGLVDALRQMMSGQQVE